MSAPGPDTAPPPHDCCPILLLPEDSLHHIFSHLPLRQVLACRCVCRLFRYALASPPFLSLLPPLPLLALRLPHHRHQHHSPPSLLAFDSSQNHWIRFPLSFLPFTSPSPVTASPSLLYLWTDSAASDPRAPSKSLVLCNPVTRSYHSLPQLGSAWSRHGTVLAAPDGHVLLLAELAALWYTPGSSQWLTFSLNLPSKPRSPVLAADGVYALCDIGSPWRSQWKLFACRLKDLGGPRGWDRLEKHEWGDVFDILKRPRLIRGRGEGRILMIGGLRSSLTMDAPCSTVLILRLDLGTLEWDEAGRMPLEMYTSFGGPGRSSGGANKVKVFGGDGRVWFSGKKVRGKMVMWEEEEVVKSGGGGRAWRWVDGVPGYGDGVYRGFVFNAGLAAVP